MLIIMLSATRLKNVTNFLYSHKYFFNRFCLENLVVLTIIDSRIILKDNYFLFGCCQ